MIERILLPEVLGMTFLARHQRSLMHIVFMVTRAALLTGTAQNAFVDVTFSTIQLQVNPDQEEVLMILRSIFPATFIVTFGAKGTVGTFVHILVTNLAIPLFDFWKEILAFKIMRVLFKALIGIFMAFRTLHLLVFTLKLKLRFFMIKFFEFGELLSRVTDSTRLIVKLGMEHILVFVHVTFFTEPTVGSFEHKLPTTARRLGG